MIFPPRLGPGCHIGLVAPGRKLSEQELREGMAPFESWKVHWHLAPSLASTSHSYLSGSDEERCADLQHLLDHLEVDVILCARGGYGTTRIIDQLDFSAFRQKPKWLVGFSDITALHLRLQKENIASIHGGMPIQFGRPEHFESLQSLFDCLQYGTFDLSAPVHRQNRVGTVRAPLIGGNLSLLVDSLGTRDEIDTAGKILLLEEVDEYHYKVDRMLTQLKRAGKSQQLAGLAIGHLTSMKETAVPFGDLAELIRNHVQGYPFPVAFGLPFGHEAPNRSWIEGAEADFQVTAQGVTLRSPAS
jgi:muramoyltetrapeptide carboxypeptidase